MAKSIGINKAKTLLATLFAFACTANVVVFASTPVLQQKQDKRPRADKSWANIKQNVLEICVDYRGGIGKTEFVLVKGNWPADIRFAFRNFKALEGFKIHTASNMFDGAIPHSVRRKRIELGQGFTSMRKGNSIYITAPAGFVRPEESSISIEWVDFYRN